MAGLTKDKPPDWRDTNMALFGSDIEKNIKKAASDGEPQWREAGVKLGTQVWRIEKFKVVPWPTSKYGKFHEGDSYIVLRTYCEDPKVNPDKLAWDIHFWIGEQSTQDEYGTAAYKTVELDDHLGGAPVQYREVQRAESDKFKGYFNGRITYLKGGIDSGFHHVGDDEAEREARLFTVKGAANNLELRQVQVSRSAMNSGDVFILDADGGIFQWNGKDSNIAERTKASEFCKVMKSDRGGKCEIRSLQEGTDEGDPTDCQDPFWKHLPGEKRFLGLIKTRTLTIGSAEKGGDDNSVTAFQPCLYRIGETGNPCVRICATLSMGNVAFTRVGKGEKLPISKLNTSDAFLYDNGFEIFVWIGKGASKNEKVSAFPLAQRYLKARKRPPVLPITRMNEGHESKQFLDHFGPAEAGCAIS